MSQAQKLSEEFIDACVGARSSGEDVRNRRIGERRRIRELIQLAYRQSPKWMEHGRRLDAPRCCAPLLRKE